MIELTKTNLNEFIFYIVIDRALSSSLEYPQNYHRGGIDYGKTRITQYHQKIW